MYKFKALLSASRSKSLTCLRSAEIVPLPNVNTEPADSEAGNIPCGYTAALKIFCSIKAQAFMKKSQRLMVKLAEKKRHFQQHFAGIKYFSAISSEKKRQ